MRRSSSQARVCPPRVTVYLLMGAVLVFLCPLCPAADSDSPTEMPKPAASPPDHPPREAVPLRARPGLMGFSDMTLEAGRRLPAMVLRNEFTAAQRETYFAAVRRPGLSPEEPPPVSEQMAAFRRLADDETLPREVRRWAELRELEMLWSQREMPKLFDEAQAWCRANPEDLFEPKVRLQLCSLLAFLPSEALPMAWEDRGQLMEQLVAPVLKRYGPHSEDNIAVREHYATWIEQIGLFTAAELTERAGVGGMAPSQVEKIHLQALALRVDAQRRRLEALKECEQIGRA